MTAASGQRALAQAPAGTGRAVDRRSLWQPARDRFPGRPDLAWWPATAVPRADAERELDRLLAAWPAAPGTRASNRPGPRLLLDWLEEQPGTTWQERWLATGSSARGAGWRAAPARWLAGQGLSSRKYVTALSVALRAAVCADIIRPSLGWLLSGGMADNWFARALAAERDPAGFARLQGLLDADPELSEKACRVTVHRAAVIVAAKGGSLGQVTAGDLLAEHAAEEIALRRPCEGMQAIYGALRAMGVIAGPATFRQLRARGPRTPEQMIDRYGIACQPVRDVLVDYLRERQPALDYSTLQQLGFVLGKLFWADIEQHHPGISGLHLPDDVARAWKQRLQVKESGGTAGERIAFRPCLTNVRAFYLDLAQWALDDPSRWARWAVPCPVRQNETVSRKMTQHRKSRMDARTRERLPVLPALVNAVTRHRADAAGLLAAARQAAAGQEFTAAGRTLVRLPVRGGSPLKVWARDPASGRRADLTGEEDYAFWGWAAIEVLRHTGIRIEELLELSHHSLVQYRLPGTGELVPLLQIVPSKTDTERLLLISPDLADVLAAVISRVRAPSGAVPLVAAYDDSERRWRHPAPLLFQRRFRGYDQALHEGTVRKMLAAAVARTGLADPAAGQPLVYTPHDFRRMFITDVVLSGLPPHIAQVIAGHRDINVTMGYKAVYPDEAIQAHRAFLARRRALRPGEEYRAPTDEEWQQFLGHFERRKVATGTCGRAFGTPCAHEHACIRCPMLWPDPAQKQRLTEIRDNLAARIAEAEREGWHGEMEGLKISLTGAEDKLTQINRRTVTTADLGIPSARH
ncbi:MAG TPA: site-specific integrase [Streptosporangiaceae bacterium]|nr:site-specific integrase [Streptosporangiaceae bacterium]